MGRANEGYSEFYLREGSPMQCRPRRIPFCVEKAELFLNFLTLKFLTNRKSLDSSIHYMKTYLLPPPTPLLSDEDLLLGLSELEPPIPSLDIKIPKLVEDSLRLGNTLILALHC